MSGISLEQLGLTQDELTNRVVDRVADRVLREQGFDEDGFEMDHPSTFAREIQKAIRDRIDAKVNEIGDKHVLPKVSEMIENVVLQETNRWGEAKGEKLTFVEYLVQRAHSYITEPVDFHGKAKSEMRDAYDRSRFGAGQTRISHMIHQHLHYHIERAMKQALADANSQIAKGLHETVKLKLNEVVGKLKVDVKTR